MAVETFDGVNQGSSNAICGEKGKGTMMEEVTPQKLQFLWREAKSLE